MAQRVSKSEQDAVEALRIERMGLTGMVQCEGCYEPNPVPEAVGVCARHNASPHHDDGYYDDPYAGYDVIGNL